MTARRHLPTRRLHNVMSFEDGGRRYVAGLGRFGDTGELAEVFLNVDGKTGSDIAEHVNTAAILVSMLLQHGVSVAAIRHSISGPAARALELAECDQGGSR